MDVALGSKGTDPTPPQSIFQFHRRSSLGRLVQPFKELKDDQLGRLQARATRSGSLAVYLFYSDSALGEAGDHLAFGRCSRPISLIREHFGPPWTTRLTPAGCTLVLAADVKRLSGRGAPKATPVEIAKVGMPWECLLCPYRPSPRSA